jgi:signal transduction histidine kinase
MNRAAGPPPLPRYRSLRARGTIATLALLLYLILAGAYIAQERSRIDETFQALDRLGRHEKALALAEATVVGSLTDVSEAAVALEPRADVPADLRQSMDTGARLFATLEEFDPGYALLQRSISRAYETVLHAPVRPNWIHLREAMQRAVDEFDIRQRRLAEDRETLTIGYRRQFDAVTVESLLLAMVGLFTFGSLAAWFFARLAHDVRALEAHARQIVSGTRGVTLPVRRQDEIGRLMHAVNRMARDLDEREQQIALDGQRRSHQDKMLAVGALAAGVAHEVNNPLAVIAGVAHELKNGAPPSPEALAESAQLILSQTQRASQVARQLAEVAAPQPEEMDWVDLNALARRVVQLMGYDRRYRGFAIDVDADPQLPAVRSSGNAIQQLVMQLLTLGCDALAASPGLPRTVRLLTRGGENRVEMQIHFAQVLDFTRPEVQRSLLLCRAIVEPLQGRLAFDQADDGTLRIKLGLPSDAGGRG